jgi:exosortase E/protease (VPEID-CTERM system)
LTLLLLAELLILQVRFDTSTLDGMRTWWSALVGNAHFVPPIALAIGSALLVFAGAGFRHEPPQLPEGTWKVHRWPFFLIAHVIALAIFAGCTARVVEGDLQSNSRWPGMWVATWALAGVATLATWGAMVLSPRQWLLLARSFRGALWAAVVIGLAAWAAGQITAAWWKLLARATLAAVHQLLALVCAETVYLPEELVVGTPSFSVEIAEPCSGCEGIGLVWVLLAAYLWMCRRHLRFPEAFLLLPFGTVAIWLANVLRVAGLVCLGSWVSPEIALGGFHSAAGWLGFTLVSLGLVVISQRWLVLAAPQDHAHPVQTAPPTSAYLLPLFAILATGLITRAFTDGKDTLYPLHMLAASVVLWHYRRAYTGLRLTWSWLAVVIGGSAFTAWVALEPAAGAESTSQPPWAHMPTAWVGPWITCRVLGAIVVVPLAEELAFRGYLLRRLQAQDFQHVPSGQFRWLPFLATSVLFGILHGRWIAGTVAGMLYGLALYRRGQLGDAVLAHSVTNALIAGCVLLGAWSLWS